MNRLVAWKTDVPSVFSVWSIPRFMESMMKIGLEYLSYHGNPTQQAKSSRIVGIVQLLRCTAPASQHVRQSLHGPGVVRTAHCHAATPIVVQGHNAATMQLQMDCKLWTWKRPALLHLARRNGSQRSCFVLFCLIKHAKDVVKHHDTFQHGSSEDSMPHPALTCHMTCHKMAHGPAL